MKYHLHKVSMITLVFSQRASGGTVTTDNGVSFSIPNQNQVSPVLLLCCLSSERTDCDKPTQYLKTVFLGIKSFNGKRFRLILAALGATE